MTSVQLVVVGGGPGGYTAAFLAADLGLSVTLIDPEPNPGGVCVYRGCIPSKALLHVANLMDEVAACEGMGRRVRPSPGRLEQAARVQERVVERLTSGTGQLAKHRKVHTFRALPKSPTPMR